MEFSSAWYHWVRERQLCWLLPAQEMKETTNNTQVSKNLDLDLFDSEVMRQTSIAMASVTNKQPHVQIIVPDSSFVLCRLLIPLLQLMPHIGRNTVSTNPQTAIV